MYSLFLSVLSWSLLHLFPLQSSPLRAPRDCFSGSYGALSHTWAFIKSLILKDKFEYLYKYSLIHSSTYISILLYTSRCLTLECKLLILNSSMQLLEASNTAPKFYR